MILPAKDPPTIQKHFAHLHKPCSQLQAQCPTTAAESRGAKRSEIAAHSIHSPEDKRAHVPGAQCFMNIIPGNPDSIVET